MKLYCATCKTEHDVGLFGPVMQKQTQDCKRKCLHALRTQSREQRAKNGIKGHAKYSFWKGHHALDAQEKRR